MKDDDLTKIIIGCAYKVHNALGTGLIEKVYENALRIELQKLGLRVKQQEPVNVRYEGEIVGEYYADLWVDDNVVIELKAVQTLAKIHEVQLVHYLTATGISTGSTQLRSFSASETKIPRIHSKSSFELNAVDIVNPVTGRLLSLHNRLPGSKVNLHELSSL